MPISNPFKAFFVVTLAIGASLQSTACALAGEPSYLLDARASACATLEGRGDIISAIQHGEDDTSQLILENTEGWVPRFNEFASSEAARILRSYAEGAMATHLGDRYSAQACSILEPALAIARSAETVGGAGGKIEPGDLLDVCKGGLCVPEALEVVEEQCEFEVFAVPVTLPCGDEP